MSSDSGSKGKKLRETWREKVSQARRAMGEEVLEEQGGSEFKLGSRDSQM